MSTQYRVPSSDNYIREMENISQRERHGLFSQPPPLSVGDRYNDSLKSKGKERGIIVNQKLSQHHEPALFSEPGYATLGDPYKDPFKAKQIYDKERELAINNPNIFKPNGRLKSIKKSEFEHMKEYNDKQYNTRKISGEVITKAKNIFTNPPKKGLGRTTINNLFGKIEYVADPYDRQEELERLERLRYRSKFLPGAGRFVSCSYGNRPFTSDGALLDGAGYLSKQAKPNQTQAAPFRPANQNKRGFQGTFEVFHYLEEGAPESKTKQNTFQRISTTQTYNRPWRPNSNGTQARPCPSVSQVLRNKSQGSQRI